VFYELSAAHRPLIPRAGPEEFRRRIGVFSVSS